MRNVTDFRTFQIAMINGGCDEGVSERKCKRPKSFLIKETLYELMAY